MLIKQDGNFQKRQYTHIYIYIYIYIYMRCNYVHLQSCTYILDVSKRGVLGSADDDIAFFAYFVIFFIMGRSISFHWFFIILTMVFNIFIVFFIIWYSRKL